MENGVMMQVFEWYLPSDGKHYERLAKEASKLAKLGISAVWMPPAAKGVCTDDVGYGNYDYWDVGEFDQKGAVRTKYGTREQLIKCIEALHAHDIDVYADMVFNHKGGADKAELFHAIPVDNDDRTKEIGAPREIEGWTEFTFPARGKKYSDFNWHHYHFNGVDFDAKTGANGVYLIVGENKHWDSDVDRERGNYDYLMNADIDHERPEVRAELLKVADWMVDTFRHDGFRLDALKHISRDFIDNLAEHMFEKYGKDFYFVGEYWQNDEYVMNQYLEQIDYQIDLFDVPFHYSLVKASSEPDFDMRTIFDWSVVNDYPLQAVTFVDNHDSQEGQALESWVNPWFREIAYALILLRKDGYPCIFWGDYAGIPEKGYSGMKKALEKMLHARHNFAYGEQDEYFASPTLIGWVRRGTNEHPQTLAVLISTGKKAALSMHVGRDKAGKTYRDLSGQNADIVIDKNGNGLFAVGARTVAYWTEKA